MRVLEGFADEAEIAHVLALAGDARALRRRGIEVNRDRTGMSCELPVGGDDVLDGLARRMELAAGVRNEFGGTLRFRRYRRGEWHPPHLDSYRVGRLRLTATALLYLTDVEQGGETHFPSAKLRIAPRQGRLLVWRTRGEDGRDDPASLHESLPVERGEKATLTCFLYAPARPKRRFVCVDDDVPGETVALLRKACRKRRVEFVHLDARSFDFAPEKRLGPGEMLYRPAVSFIAQRVEQFLWSPGVATFHADGPFFEATAPAELFERAGIPVPRSCLCASADPELLRGFVRALGGLPVVLKVGGGEGGVGVMRADSFPALFSLVDHALAQGHNPQLSAFVDQAVHHRVIVVGDRAVAAYRNAMRPDDFRTWAAEEKSAYTARVPRRLADLAVRAVKALRLELGGVDILEHGSGRLYVLESNFPCYHPQAEKAGGIDVSGAMVEFLMSKAAKLSAPGAA